MFTKLHANGADYQSISFVFLLSLFEELLGAFSYELVGVEAVKLCKSWLGEKQKFQFIGERRYVFFTSIVSSTNVISRQLVEVSFCEGFIA